MANDRARSAAYVVGLLAMRRFADVRASRMALASASAGLTDDPILPAARRAIARSAIRIRMFSTKPPTIGV